MSNSVQPHGRQPTRLPCPWDSLGKNTGVGCHFLLQCVKVKSESEVAQSWPTPSDPMDCSLPGASIHGIFQARVLEWGAIPKIECHSKKTKYISAWATEPRGPIWPHLKIPSNVAVWFLTRSGGTLDAMAPHLIRISIRSYSIHWDSYNFGLRIGLETTILWEYASSMSRGLGLITYKRLLKLFC